MTTLKVIKRVVGVAVIAITTTVTHAAPEGQQNEQTKNLKTSLIEYMAQKDFKYSPLKDIGNGTFYYWNEARSPEMEPRVSNDAGVRSIEIFPTTSTPKGIESGEANLARVVKIPPNPPKSILIKFKTRLTAVPCDKTWLSPAASSKKRIGPHMIITFAKESGETGGGADVPLGEPNGQWVDHQIVVPIPTGADYLKIGMATYCGFNLALGDWTIQ